ncbi:Sm-like protein lsm1b [Ancistrocladus abbreviatus]
MKILDPSMEASSLTFLSVLVWIFLAAIPYVCLNIAEKLLVLLRDGRKLIGTLRSFDQFANAVLEGACERVIVGDLYSDIPLGFDVEKEDLPQNMTRVSNGEIRRAQKAERESTDLKGSMRKRMEFLDLD